MYLEIESQSSLFHVLSRLIIKKKIHNERTEIFEEKIRTSFISRIKDTIFGTSLISQKYIISQVKGSRTFEGIAGKILKK